MNSQFYLFNQIHVLLLIHKLNISRKVTHISEINPVPITYLRMNLAMELQKHNEILIYIVK